jgi:Ser/Thr protein kinase RdoA (MazF antagonist)
MAQRSRLDTAVPGWEDSQEARVVRGEETDPGAVLAEYDVGAVKHVVGAGGTAGRTWRVTAAGGEYLLRLRGVRTSTCAHLEYDHGLRAHLVVRGVPTACAVRTRQGERWVHRQGRVYELYPFVIGRPFDPRHSRELACAAEALAAFHRAAHDYEPPSVWRQTVAQYTTLGFSDEVSDRMDDPRLQLINLQGTKGLAETPAQAGVVDRCIARVRALEHTYGGDAYRRLAGYVIHGDYTPANVVYSLDGEVAGIFDFDWSMAGARCLDVAYGLCFFATEPRAIDAASIWSLTDASDFSVDRCAAFLRAYHSAWPLRADEIHAIPHAFCSLWLSKRLEGMAKVEPHQRFRFFSRDVEKPLLWMDANWERLFRASFF